MVPSTSAAWAAASVALPVTGALIASGASPCTIALAPDAAATTRPADITTAAPARQVARIPRIIVSPLE
nr:hypothetical protein GCM10025730_11810 [Promicromonospora thailandica]